MSDLEYFFLPEYQEFLISSKRRTIYPPEALFSSIKLSDARNIVDFGCGMGFLIPEIQKVIPKDTWIWAGDCQQDLLDLILRRKLMEGWEKVSPFYIDRSDHPLLPEWIPVPDVIIASLSISTFPNPGLAMDGLVRSMKPEGKLVIIDWSKVDFSYGPRLNEKVSLDKMKFLAEDYNLEVINTFKVSDYFYGIEVQSSRNFVYGFLDLKDEEDDVMFK